MLKFIIICLWSLIVFGCSTISHLFEPPFSDELLQVKQRIIACELNRASQISQRYTVKGNLEEKKLAYKYLGIIYLELNDQNKYQHTLNRFLFSIRDRHYKKNEVINLWNKSRQDIKNLRFEKIARTSCNF